MINPKLLLLELARLIYNPTVNTLLHKLTKSYIILFKWRGSEKIREVWGIEFDSCVLQQTQYSLLLIFSGWHSSAHEVRSFLSWFACLCGIAETSVESKRQWLHWANFRIWQLQEFQDQHGKSVNKQPPKQSVWRPPDPSTLKTNFVGAVFEELGAADIKVVVRNSSGEIMAALSEIIPLPSSIVVLETIAARRAVKFLQELDLHSSIFEWDS